MKIIETEQTKTIVQHDKFSGSSFNKFPSPVVAMTINSPNPTTNDNVKNLFLNGFDLKQ